LKSLKQHQAHAGVRDLARRSFSKVQKRSGKRKKSVRNNVTKIKFIYYRRAK